MFYISIVVIYAVMKTMHLNHVSEELRYTVALYTHSLFHFQYIDDQKHTYQISKDSSDAIGISKRIF